jgi:hypothetical protein
MGGGSESEEHSHGHSENLQQVQEVRAMLHMESAEEVHRE